ncbi:RNA polymerase factor sigma-32 [Oceanicella actignis]|uniref:RNA polymerase sigma-32 factor n=1 Tax=Oceanicella actignis TaxID=1189325 RepID=A0A1M7SV72_9RHOB|nr:RNA polymerase factor sigma-32 [Oceanicella actignis]TYO90636.1 RNA polymerase RpoH-like sigma 32 subunit [Oceanicella actignis]SES72102.1 RNA polymerase, sigma 32 subunit, RpoH [Oceanicella actignis]SHN62331.1 RNA polymerase sigma-32 factor [Oceanicella actignis]
MATSIPEGAGIGRAAMSAELLDAETEQELARRWRDKRDERALHRLVTAYMRLAVSMAAKYRRYGASLNDLTQEAAVGLMKAAEKFDPDRGVRFSTYAAWWVKASIQDYVMRNWSLVRTGSTSAQKSLFFNMRRVRAQVEREAWQGDEPLAGDQIRERIAQDLGLSLRDVEMMEGRLAGSDFSLNALQSGEEGREWVETLEDEGPQADEIVGRRRDLAAARAWIRDAMGALTEREQLIIAARKLRDPARTLESLGAELNLSKERVRQLEAQALRKMRQRMEESVGPEARELVAAL